MESQGSAEQFFFIFYSLICEFAVIRGNTALNFISALFWDFIQRRTVVYYDVAGSLKMGQIGCTETPIINYRYTLRKVPK